MRNCWSGWSESEGGLSKGQTFPSHFFWTFPHCRHGAINWKESNTTHHPHFLWEAGTHRKNCWMIFLCSAEVAAVVPAGFLSGFTCPTSFQSYNSPQLQKLKVFFHEKAGRAFIQTTPMRHQGRRSSSACYCFAVSLRYLGLRSLQAMKKSTGQLLTESPHG